MMRMEKTKNIEYYDLTENGQKKIDKIDKYFHKFAKSFSRTLLLTLGIALLLVARLLGFIQIQTLVFQGTVLEFSWIALIILVVNMFFLYNDYQEIKTYMFHDLIKVYKKYS